MLYQGLAVDALYKPSEGLFEEPSAILEASHTWPDLQDFD